jgi:hypothetical protein
MQRGLYDPVTDEYRVPVLVSAKSSHRDGFATFFRELSPPTPVRVFRDCELRDARQHLTPEEVQHFMAVIDLTTALQNPSDSIVLRKARERLLKVYDAKRSELPDLSPLIDGQFSAEVKKNTDLSPREAMEFLITSRPSPRAAKDARWLLSEELSEMLSASSRLVLWWTGERFTPAIWCENVKTAFYVRALLSAVRGKGIRICPHCSEVFFQQRSDQNYCSVAHREAHRVARWRAMKLSSSKRKGDKRVTRKTR